MLLSQILPAYFLPTIASALLLGVYDLTKKHAVKDNSVMEVLFFATLCGSITFCAIAPAVGGKSVWQCDTTAWWLILGKSALVATSWGCVYYAMRDLPISLAAPIRASAPLWTFIGGLILFGEVPSVLQGVAMGLIFIGYYCFSILGKLENFDIRHSRSVRAIIAGTLLGAAAALYDKFLLNTLGISRITLQFWFCADLVLVLGIAFLFKKLVIRRSSHVFQWRYTIALTGLLLILADFCYFYAVSLPDIHISIISLVRRSSCVVAFAGGALLFHDKNIRKKSIALLLVLLGIALLAVAK